MDWKPFSTAPEDTEILVASEHGVHTAWRGGSFCYVQAAGREPRTIHEDPIYVDHPTHWLPLPEPPK